MLEKDKSGKMKHPLINVSGIQTNYGTSADRIMIGAHLNASSPDYNFDGDIGEVRVRNRSMSAAEISESYNKRKTRYK